MGPLLLGVLAGVCVWLLLGPGPAPGRHTPLSRVYLRLAAAPNEEGRTTVRIPWVRRVPVGPLVGALRPFFPAAYEERIRKLLIVSRLNRSHTYTDVLAMKITYTLVCWVYAGLLMLKHPDFVLGVFLLGLGGLAFYHPDVWLRSRARQRQDQVRRELPALLSAMAMALEAGLHLMGAIAEVVRARQGELAAELRDGVDLYHRGMSLQGALETVTERLDVPELTVVFTSLLQAFGKGATDVVGTVRAQAADAWQNRRRRAETLAQTASMRLFLPIALLALPGFMIFLLGPAVLEVVDYFTR